MQFRVPRSTFGINRGVRWVPAYGVSRLLTAKEGPDFDICVRKGSITVGVAKPSAPGAIALPGAL